MHTVFLQTDGSILEDGKPVRSEPLQCLSCRIRLEDNYSLRSFFRLCKTYPVLLELNQFLPVCLKRYGNSPDSGCVHDDFDYLEFSKTVEMIGFPGKPRLEIYMSFKGIHDNESGELKQIPLEHLLDMPLLLGRLKHVVFGDKVDVLEFDTVYTLFDFVDGIGWALSFHGTPLVCDIRR